MDAEEYRIIEQISENTRSKLFRAVNGTSDNVILKILRDDYSNIHKTAQFRREFEITSSLKSPWIIRAIKLSRFRNNLAMELEDFGGVSVRSFLQNLEKNYSKITLRKKLSISLSIAEALHEVHQANIIHKDINPNNILINPNNELVKIIDFGLASHASHEKVLNYRDSFIQGTLPYVSPEQTGRMNRTMDYRTDYYSLGITLFEIFEGELPFSGSSVNEWIYNHVAVKPKKTDPNLPRAINQVIERLMQKNIEDRYQSGESIISDLKLCLEALENKELIDLNINNIRKQSVYSFPQKLYGRKKELERLEAAVEDAFRGDQISVLVEGFSGIGKSALINEIWPVVVKKRGYYLKGKCDINNQDIPYFAFKEAVNGLVNQLISEGDMGISFWKNVFREELGDNLKLIHSIFQELDPFVSQEMVLPDLSPTESYNRFLNSFKQFLRLLGQKTVLVIFIDDLQWSDTATLNLIKEIVSDRLLSNILFIGSYRHNEIPSGHPVAFLKDELLRMNPENIILKLESLTESDFYDIIKDSFGNFEFDISDIVSSCYSKTYGNPFYLNYFLTSLVQKKLIYFDTVINLWKFDKKKIEHLSVPDDVADYIEANIGNVPDNNKYLLKVASCIGDQFTVSELSTCSSMSRDVIFEMLQDSITKSFIFPLSHDFELVGYDQEYDTSFIFAHDKIKQAIYEHLSTDERVEINLKIGLQFLQEYYTTNCVNKDIFRALVHLNQVWDYLNAEQKEITKQLNFLAARKSKLNGAFSVGFQYIMNSLRQVEDSDWSVYYTETYRIYIEAIELSYLAGQYDKMNALILYVRKFTREYLHDLEITEIETKALISRSMQVEAVIKAINDCKKLGIHISHKPNLLSVIQAIVKTNSKLKKYSRDQLVNLPVMENPEILIAVKILSNVLSASYWASPNLFPMIVTRLVQLTLTHGIAPKSPVSFVTFGLLTGVMGDLNKARYFSETGLELLEKHSLQKDKGQAMVIHLATVMVWLEPIKQVAQELLKNTSVALEHGDLEYAVSSAAASIAYSFFSGNDINETIKTIDEYYKILSHLHQQPSINHFGMYRESIVKFQNFSFEPYILKGDLYDEDIMIREHIASKDDLSAFTMYLNKMILAYYFRHFTIALEVIKKAKKHIKGVAGVFQEAMYYFYSTLTYLAIYDELNFVQRLKISQVLNKNIRKIKKWAKSSPENMLNKLFIIEAERERIRRNQSKAIVLYDKAIKMSHEQNFLNEEALCNELAARYWTQQKVYSLAEMYYKNAFRLYELWGANGKIIAMEADYYDFIFNPSVEIKPGKNPNTSILTTSITHTHTSVESSMLLEYFEIISDQKNIRNLYSNTISIILRLSAAQKGVFISVSSSGKDLTIKVTGVEKNGVIEIMPMNERPDNELVPVALIQQVIQTGDKIVISNAFKNAKSKIDEYVIAAQVRSLAIIPVKTNKVVTGIMYLENNLLDGVFTDGILNHVELLIHHFASNLRCLEMGNGSVK